MMTIRRLALALLLCIAGVASSRADEIADRLLAAFRSICMVKPDSLWAIDALATAQGFARRFDPAKVMPQKPADEFDLMLDWRRGEGRDAITLLGLALNRNPLNYALLCQMNAAVELLPDDIIAGLKAMPGLGEPQSRQEKEGGVTLQWKIPADPRRDVVELHYRPGKGRQRLHLSFEQAIETPLPK